MPRIIPAPGGGSSATTATIAALGLLRGQGWGLALSNNVSDANNDIDIAAGACGPLGYDAWMVTAGLTKRLDAAWAVGTNQGGLDTGAKGNSTWYHVHLIRRSDTGVVDALFSTSATSPTMPTSYDQRQRIGSVLTDGSANILAFCQIRDAVLWKSPPLDVNTGALGTTATTYTLSVPAIDCEALLNVGVSNASAQRAVYLSTTDLTDLAASSSAAPLASQRCNVINAPIVSRTSAWTKAGVIRAVADGASTTLRVATLGWVDPRWRA